MLIVLTKFKDTTKRFGDTKKTNKKYRKHQAARPKQTKKAPNNFSKHVVFVLTLTLPVDYFVMSMDIHTNGFLPGRFYTSPDLSCI